MARNPTIELRKGERAFIVGSTGSGKTYLARRLLWGAPNVVVLDLKHGFTWSDKAEASTGGSKYDYAVSEFADLQAWKGKRPVIYQPPLPRAGMESLLDEFFALMWYWKTPLVYCDEIMTIAPNGGKIPHELLRCITQGRQRGVTMVFGSQRPANIPKICVSESQHYFTGRLAVKADRERMADLTLPELRDMKVPKFTFMYANESLDGLVKVSADDVFIRRMKR